MVAGPREVVAGPREVELEDDGRPRPPARRLALALAEAGPPHAAFGRYLGSRADVFPVSECLELSAIPDRGPGRTAEEVDALLGAELGRPRDEVFPAFQGEPFFVGLYHQSHRALLADGQSVVVRLRAPWFDGFGGFDGAGGYDPDHALTDLVTVLEGRGAELGLGYSGAVPFAELLGDFRAVCLPPRRDLRIQGESLARLRTDAEGLDGIRVPRVFAHLGSARVLVVETFQGASWDEVTRMPLEAAAGHDLARRLSLAWLQLAISTETLPIEAEIEVSRDRQLTFTGGVFTGLPAASRPRLWDYLRATAGHFPDRAAASLLEELEPGPGADPIELRTRYRQVVPFRDGGWTQTGESVAEYGLQHWRWARAAGYRTPEPLVGFFRGLFWVARRGHDVAPETDPVGAGLDGLQWLASFNQWRQLTAPRQALQTAEGYFSSLLLLPQKVDRLLATLEHGDDGGRRTATPGTADLHRSEGGAGSSLALVLGMAASAMLVRSLEGLGESVLWIEGAGIVLFGVLGLLLLLRAMRGGRR